MRTIRLTCGLLVFGVAAGAAYWLLGHGETARLRADRDRLEREQQELRRVIDRLTQEQRVAEVIVTKQRHDASGRVLDTEIQFIELDRDGHALAPRTFSLPGHVIYFDGLVIKFAHDLVAAGDPLRGRSIMLFRRIFSEIVAPKDGPLIDADGDVPDVFRVNPKPSEVEQRLWQRFWLYATDPEAARREGIRVAQGEAVYAPMTEGQRWTLTLDADGGLCLSITAPANR